MLVLFETPAGLALFKVLNEGKLKKADDVGELFRDAAHARKMVELKEFFKFENTAVALEEATALQDNTLGKGLEGFLRKAKISDTLAVADAKLGGLIKEKVGVQCLHNKQVEELMRGVRAHFASLVSGLSEADMGHMALGLSHSLCRYKLKFSPDKVDVMIVQAISLLDDLDKELNIYAMRVKEWYGWHFPELTRVVGDNILYAKVVRAVGMRTNVAATDLSELLTEDVMALLVEAAKISMGTEVSSEDISRISALADQVIAIHEYREQLNEYLRHRMQAIAPNLSVLVGELVGARLIAHAGSLLSLAKYPASTVQILGAEKALFRALKAKKDTPKYGLIFNASMVSQVPPKLKGKISRSLSAKSSLAIRVDALGDSSDAAVGIAARDAIEARIRALEGSNPSLSRAARSQPKHYEPAHKDRSKRSYDAADDVTMLSSSSKKRHRDEGDSFDDKKKKKHKKHDK